MHCACTRIDANGSGSAATSAPAAKRFGHFADTSAESGIAPGCSRNVRLWALVPTIWRSIGCAAIAIVSSGCSPATNSCAATRWRAAISRHSRNPAAAALWTRYALRNASSASRITSITVGISRRIRAVAEAISRGSVTSEASARVAFTLTKPGLMVLPHTAHGPPNERMRPEAIAFSSALPSAGLRERSLSFRTRTRAFSVSTPPRMKQSESGCAAPRAERNAPKPWWPTMAPEAVQSMKRSASRRVRKPPVESVTARMAPSPESSGSPQTCVCQRHSTPASSSISRATRR